jgi:hypothetical protein
MALGVDQWPASQNGLTEASVVRRQGLEPRTR